MITKTDIKFYKLAIKEKSWIFILLGMFVFIGVPMLFMFTYSGERHEHNGKISSIAVSQSYGSSSQSFMVELESGRKVIASPGDTLSYTIGESVKVIEKPYKFMPRSNFHVYKTN